MVDIIEVGAGGGSIAWVDPTWRPESRAAERRRGARGRPAYGRGGTEPTVTDGNLMIGRLNAEKFLGGEMDLDRGSGGRAIERVVPSHSA